MSWATLRRTGYAELLALLVAAGACSREASATAVPTPVAPAPFHRDIRVRLACDEEFRATVDWEAMARRRFEAASDVYEKRFGIRWQIVDVVEWKSDDAAASLGDLLDQLEKDVSRTGVEVAVGFTGQTQAKGAAFDDDARGKARFFGPVAVVSSREPGASEKSGVGVLVHELGHVLGAWHCANPKSVMYESTSDSDMDAFDAETAAEIEVVRDIDFARGVDWLDEERRIRIGAIFRSGHAPHVHLPHVEAETRRARVLFYERDDAAAGRALYRRAISDQEACVGPNDPSVADCLTSLAAADLFGPGKDFDEAERLARRAGAIAAAAQVQEDPPLESEFVLARIAWERGRRHEAISRYRKVYAVRLSALGAADFETVAVRTDLDERVREEPRSSAPSSSVEFASTDVRGLPVNPSITFGAPQPDTIHLPRVPLTKAWCSGPPPSDFGRDAFDVAVAAPGTLAMELIEIGGAPGALPEVCCRVAEHVPATNVTSAECSVGFGYWTIDPKIPADGAAYRFALVVRSPENPRGSTIESVDCEAPWSARSSVDRTLDADGAAFIRFPVGAVELFRRAWLGVPPGPPVALGDVSPKRTWRLVLTFTPDAPK